MLFFQAFNELLFILTCIAVITSITIQLISALRKTKKRQKP